MGGVGRKNLQNGVTEHPGGGPSLLGSCGRREGPWRQDSPAFPVGGLQTACLRGVLWWGGSLATAVPPRPPAAGDSLLPRMVAEGPGISGSRSGVWSWAAGRGGGGLLPGLCHHSWVGAHGYRPREGRGRGQGPWLLKPSWKMSQDPRVSQLSCSGLGQSPHPPQAGVHRFT